MPWHVVAQVGGDDYHPSLTDNEPRFVATIDKPGASHSITQQLLSPAFAAGLKPSSTAVDLLNLADMIYTADLRVWRGYSPEDAWTREIKIYLPVANPDKWNASRTAVIDFLSFLTGDVWDIEFRQKAAQVEPAIGKSSLLLPESVCLFSGGLDSFVGAIDLLASGKRLAMVGHYGNSQREQEAAFRALKQTYNSQILPLWFYLVPPTMAKGQEVESTMRARSILFLSLGAAVASALPAGTPMYVPENGPISLNVPLTFGRTGTHSTRTTHPHTINLFRKVLAALGLEIPIVTPYRFATKGEMLRDCKDQEALKAGIHSTMSCSRPQSGRFHGLPVGQACGYCVPCIIRRASMRVVGLDDETTNKDVLDKSIKAQ